MGGDENWKKGTRKRQPECGEMLGLRSALEGKRKRESEGKRRRTRKLEAARKGQNVIMIVI